MNFNLTSSVGRELLAEKILADIDEYCRVKYDDGPRRHLGASLLGHPCSMYLWQVFRWCHEEKFDGRMQRLFQRGHLEEKRFVEYLRATGWTINEFEPGTENQIRIQFSEGHGGGSLDAKASHPIYTLDQIFLGEFKTYNEKQFAKLQKDKVQKAKPQHWGQMCCYGFKRQIRYGLYFAACKNDDKIHIEVKELDWSLGEELLRKGEAVILSQQPPPRISENPAWQDCKWCGKYPTCHMGQPVDKNCRSCRYAEPRINGVWDCTHPAHTGAIPPDFIKVGCPDHHAIIGPMLT